MKRFFSALIVLTLSYILFPRSVYSADENPLVTELNIIDNDSTFRNIYFYNGHGMKVMEVKYYQKDNSWIRDTQREWVYDGANCITQRESKWKSGGWSIMYVINNVFSGNRLLSETHTSFYANQPILLNKISFEYSNDLLSVRNEYKHQGDSWIQTVETIYTYYSDKKVHTHTSTIYKSGIADTRFRSVFAYYTDGLLSTQVNQQKETDTEWVNTEMVNWYYKQGTSLVSSQRNKKWNAETATWENTHKTENHYDAGNRLISETYQRWKLMFWENDTRYNYVYDNKGLLLKKELLLPIYNQWRGTVSVHYTDFFQNKSNLIESKYEFWGGKTGELTTSFIPFMFNNEMVVQKARQIKIGYLAVRDSTLRNTDLNDTDMSLPVYPNPSNGIYYIDKQGYDIRSWIVADLNGRIVMTNNGFMVSGMIDITGLPPGVYMLRVNTAEKQFFRKLIKNQ